MSTQMEDFAKTVWKDFITSKTVKAVLAAEVVAVAGFAQSVASGALPLSRASVAAFVASQVAALVVLTLRHALAELRSISLGFISSDDVSAIEKKTLENAIATLQAKGHTVAADALKDALDPKNPVKLSTV
jgi:hypothetical protein